MPASPTHAKPRKLVLLSSGLGFTARGIEIWMQEMAAHFREPGWEIELWSGGSGAGGRSLHGIGRDSRLWKNRSWHRRYELEQLSVLPLAISKLRLAGADVVYCGDPVLTWHLKRTRWLHGSAVVFMNGMRLSPSWARHFDGVHLLAPQYLGDAMVQLKGQTTGHFFAVPHFVDTTHFRPAAGEAERQAARDHFGLPRNAFIVLTIGPVGTVSGKRLEFLAQEIAASGTDILLVSAGVEEDGAVSVRQQVQEHLKDRVRFLGRTDRASIPVLLRAANVYSLGSLAEPFSIAILEALSTGLPVVHHRDEVMTWQCEGGGVPVCMKTPGQAAEAFRQLCSSESLRMDLSKQARLLAEKRYAPGPICHALAGEFESTIRQGRS